MQGDPFAFIEHVSMTLPLLPEGTGLSIAPAWVELFMRVFEGASLDGEALPPDAVRAHLEGSRRLLVDPVTDGCCRFIVLSFVRRKETASWRGDATHFAAASRRMGVEVLLEMLPDGASGIHAWVFLAAPTPVLQARRLGAALLHHASDGDVKVLGSFGRVFPSDASEPPGLIALPLCGALRLQAQSVFLGVARGMHVLADQAGVLAAAHRVDADTVAALTGEGAAVSRADRQGRLEAVLSASLVLPRPLPPALASRLRHRLVYPHPEYVRRRQKGQSVKGVPRRLVGWKRQGTAWLVPRGLAAEVAEGCDNDGIACTIVDVRTRVPVAPRAVPPGLGDDLRVLLERLRRRHNAMLVVEDDFTRTAAALALIAERGQTALVLAANRTRAEHWREQALLGGFDDPEVTHLADARVRVPLVVATYAEVKERPERVDGRFGFLVADECHRIPFEALEIALRSVPASCVLGLSAGRRSDGLDDLVELHVGPAVRLQARGEDGATEVVMRSTRFVGDDASASDDDRVEPEIPQDELFAMPRPARVRPATPQLSARSREWNGLLDALACDASRIDRVCGDVVAEASRGRRCVVLTARQRHAQAIVDELTRRGIDTALVTGSVAGRPRLEAFRAFHEGRAPVLVVMDQLLGPGFDPASTSCVFLATPVSSEGLLRQILSFLQRGGEAVDTRLYDYVDEAVPRLARMAAKRRRIYASTRTTLNPDAMQLRLPFDDSPDDRALSSADDDDDLEGLDAR